MDPRIPVNGGPPPARDPRILVGFPNPHFPPIPPTIPGPALPHGTWTANRRRSQGRDQHYHSSHFPAGHSARVTQAFNQAAVPYGPPGPPTHPRFPPIPPSPGVPPSESILDHRRLIYDIAAARNQPLTSQLPAHIDDLLIQDPPKPYPPEYTTYSSACDHPRLSMAPAELTNVSGSSQAGPHPSYIQVAKPFLFHQQIQGQLVAIGTNVSREDTYRLMGIQWINDVRTALQL